MFVSAPGSRPSLWTLTWEAARRTTTACVARTLLCAKTVLSSSVSYPCVWREHSCAWNKRAVHVSYRVSQADHL